ncbi:sensor histidine kinase [Arthrobacter bambusae]|uniref:ATP-binding protein n=1 Tax=Arthrobacter TaxID=1663 RepID=UPI001F50B2B0|nr:MULTISPECIES: sensor histidine kinase [Arthrobacter]MCI0141312.1 sensor histidine kinase [Arthrobacter bambusae]UYY82165.1 sensor histidine kinase [Arthrobacter sp. YA7-1]
MRFFGARWKARPLASQILVWLLCILFVTVTLGALLYTQISNQTLEDQYRLRALGIATTVAQMPEIVTSLGNGDPTHSIQAIASKVQSQAQPDYVVVTDRKGVRYSHPNPNLIGQTLEEPVAVLDGQTHVGIDKGSLGDSVNAKAPVRAADGTVVGQVSVGILETTESSELTKQVLLIAGYSAVVLVISAMGSALLARRIKRVTFDLEPVEIASLLQEREALLHGIREAMIGFDDDGRVTVINSEARSLLHLEENVLGEKIEDLLPAGRLRSLLTGQISGTDQIVITEDALLVVNRMSVALAGRSIGSVVTLRDRTEVEGLVRDLRSVEGLMEALRAQEHEYANRLHVVDGLLELGDVDQARNFVSRISDTSRSLGEGLRSRIEPPELAALLLAKITVAAEQDVTISVTDDSQLRQPFLETQALLTIVGNLLDNAVEILAEQPTPREVSIQLDDSSGIFICVTDNGPGVPAELVGTITADGFTTKEPRPGMRRGIGLALVSRIVHRAGGTMDVFPGPGGRFEIWLPEPHMESETPVMTGQSIE